MRTWPRRGLACASLALALCTPAASGWAEARDASQRPAGDPADSAQIEADLDPLFDTAFDDAFDAELDLTSDMQRSDPFESANRRVFQFNQGIDRFLFEPVTRGYRFLVPDPARKGIRRVFLNLDSPRIFVNDLLQLRFVDAGTTLTRFLLNSTLGVGGLLEAGDAAGLERHDSDFGQTLALYGVASGPYIMLPIFGPSTVRDGIGSIVDLAFQPLTYILGPGQILVNVYISGGMGFTALDANRDKVDALEASSVDFYAAMRSAYLQNRRAAVAEIRSPEAQKVKKDLDPHGEAFPGATVEARAHSAY